MSPGPVEARKAQLPQLAAAPFFLVGNDPLSRDWLARYGGKLAKMGAVGFLVQAESDADLMAMRQLASGVPITPLDATSLAKTLRLSHYPVLVSAGLIEQ
jgi:integrating conjugative element protein (TIGR03765 family)